MGSSQDQGCLFRVLLIRLIAFGSLFGVSPILEPTISGIQGYMMEKKMKTTALGVGFKV